MQIEVRPLDGIYWEDKVIRLGDTKEQVKAVLNVPEEYVNIYYYNDMETSYGFDAEGKVMSIGCLDNEKNQELINEGDSKEQVKKLLGDPEIISDCYYYFDSELSINFDEENKVEYIEFLAGIEGNIQPVVYGRPFFSLTAEEAYELLKERNNGEIEDNEEGRCYSFLNTSIGIYRMASETDIEEMIEEMSSDGMTEEEIEDDENLQNEREQAARWSTFGIGCADYYRTMN